MKNGIVKTALIALGFWIAAAGLSLAEQPQPQKAKQADAAGKTKAAAKKAKPAPPQAEPVDINSASKEELKKLPGITDADADKIIAGRPYLTKAHLVTHKIISAGVYEGLRKQIVAKQKDAKFAKGAKK